MTLHSAQHQSLHRFELCSGVFRSVLTTVAEATDLGTDGVARRKRGFSS